MKALMTRLVRQYFESATAQEGNRGFRVSRRLLVSSHLLNMLQYKIELRIRNHNTFDRPTILKELAECVPTEHRVDLTDPEVFILVEVMKVNQFLSHD
jgi:adenylyl- and sulfurtransferase ThiI